MRGIAVISFLFVLVTAVTLIAVRVNTVVKAKGKQMNKKLVKDVETFLDKGKR